MFQTGSQINPALGRVDYSAYTQGAVAGGQSIGQGIANLGQSIAGGIEKYTKQKKENKQLEAKLKGSIVALESLGQIAKGVSPEADASYTGLMSKLNDPSVSITEKVALSDAAQGTLKELISFGIQANTKRDAATATNLALASSQTGQPIPSNYSPEIMASAGTKALEFAGQQSQINKTAAEIAAIGIPKPKAITFESVAEARAAGQAANPDFSIKVEPASGGGYTYVPILPAQSNPDAAAGAIIAQQVPILQATFSAAENAPAKIANIHQQKDLINSGKVPTGLLSSVENSFNTILSLFGNKSAEASAARTAEYDKLLSKTTFDAMQTSGLRATQLNTEKEWERFNNAIAAVRTNPKEAALAVLDLNEKAERAVLEQHNKNRKAGKYKRFLDLSLIPYSDIEMPPAYSIKKPVNTIDAGGKQIPSANSIFDQPEEKK